MPYVILIIKGCSFFAERKRYYHIFINIQLWGVGIVLPEIIVAMRKAALFLLSGTTFKILQKSARNVRETDSNYFYHKFRLVA